MRRAAVFQWGITCKVCLVGRLRIKIANTEFPIDKIQIITVEDLLDNMLPQLPGASENKTFKRGSETKPKAKAKDCLIKTKT